MFLPIQCVSHPPTVQPASTGRTDPREADAMPGCPYGRAATAFEGAHHDSDTLSAMEQQNQDISSPRVAVAVAATEAPVHDAENSRILAKYYQCAAKFCSVALLGLAVGPTGFFLYAWVAAFREVRFRSMEFKWFLHPMVRE